MERKPQNEDKAEVGTRTYRTVLIGRGNVASHLQEALTQAGHQVLALGGRNRTQPIPQNADLYIIAVTDSAIQGCSRHRRCDWPGGAYRWQCTHECTTAAE